MAIVFFVLLPAAACESAVFHLLALGVLTQQGHGQVSLYFTPPTTQNTTLTLFCKEINDGREEPAEAEKHAEVSSNISNQCISIMNEELLLHFIIS